MGGALAEADLQGRGELRQVPEFQVRIKFQKREAWFNLAESNRSAAGWISSYSDGLPVVTNLNLNTSAARKGITPEEMFESPAALEAMERIMDRVKKKRVRPVTEPQ